ncbi:MAG: 3-hydroxyacyl-CoA dehydrogenase/enoyl-CoA hydratase family protein [Wenzhouxiangellaceae bacterium]
MSANPPIRQAAVLGAGVMGAQIAAHLVNAGIDTLLYELPAKDGDANGLVKQAIARLGKLKPAPLGYRDVAQILQPCNYQDDLERLGECDLIIEAIAERMDWKQDLYRKVAPHIGDNAIFASNTSGLSITTLAGELPEALRGRFLGVHFFNPPRYMYLVELIPHAGTDADVLDRLETILTTTVGKGVVRAKDTPNFIGNRVGVFSMLSTMHHTQAFGLGFDVADALTGPAIGRPKSATYRTADVVGLDTMSHVIGTMTATLEDDPWHRYFATPKWLQQLIDQGALGQKTGVGIYRKQGKKITVLDLEQQDYRPSDGEVDAGVQAILKERDPAKKLAALRSHDHPQAQFLWAVFRDLFHYCAYFLDSIADSAREVDEAIRWGYGWKQGPFEIWQAAGWRQIADWIAEDIAAGKSMSDAPLPAWVRDGREGVHSDAGSYSAARDTIAPRSTLPVYQRQLQPERLVGEHLDHGTTVHEDDAVRLWTLDDEILLISFKSKMYAIGQGVVNGLLKAIELAERDYRGLVIWQAKEPFCVGADLAGVAEQMQAGNPDAVRHMLGEFQRAVMALKYATVPTIAAVRGMALGGGCEVALACSHVVAAHESYMGLVEVGVGLNPGGGGLKEMALRARDWSHGGDAFVLLREFYQNIAMGKVSGSAHEARQMGYLRPTDTIIMNANEILHVAISQAKAMTEAGYRPPLRNRRWAAIGDVGVANLRSFLANMHEGHFISDYDREIGRRIAEIMSGGSIDRDTLVTEDWYLQLEQQHFMELVVQQPTQERIAHMLKTGKPLRN